MVELKLHYGDEQIPYKLFQIQKQTKKVSIHIHPDGSVQVDAPSDIPLADIKRAVYKRARWIYNNKNEVKSNKLYALPREYVSGESHYYLGKQYILKIFKVKKQSPSVKLLHGQLQVRTSNTSKNVIKALLWQWYRDHAIEMFDRRLDELWKDIRWLKEKPEWKLLTMKKQWGSCSPKGVLSVNPYLVKAPRECIDYVIIHELCHLKIHNHSKDYYKLLKKTMPEWEPVKARLDGMAELLLAW